MPVDEEDCQVLFRFTGNVAELTYKLGPMQLSSDEHQVIQHALTKRHD